MRAAREYVAAEPRLSWNFHVRRAREFTFTWHFHPEVELTLITEGSGIRIVGDSVENYRPGDLTMIGSEVPHTYVSAADTDQHEAIVIQFRRDFLGAEFVTRPEFAFLGRLLDAATGGLHFDTQPLHAAELRRTLAEPPLDRTIGLIRLLARLADSDDVRTLVTVPSDWRVSEADRQRIDTVCAHLQLAYEQPVQLSDVAAIAHMTPAAFSRFFRRALGRTLTDYVNELRVAAACQLLADSTLPVASIASRSGFANLSNFNRRFRQLKGLSPREYRRAVAGQQERATPTNTTTQPEERRHDQPS